MLPWLGALSAQPGMRQTTYVAPGMAVRRLTPRECDRLQAFPDDYTLIPFGRTIHPEKLDQDWIKYLLRGGGDDTRPGRAQQPRGRATRPSATAGPSLERRLAWPSN